MDYDPSDQKVTFRQVLAAWILCFAMIGAAFAATGHHPATPTTNAGDPPHAVIAACCAISGARLPHFAPCAGEPGGAVRTARGPLSLPVNACS